MKVHVRALVAVLATITGACVWITTSPVTAVDTVHYSFDFNDGTMPDSLGVFPLKGDSRPAPTCEVSNGRLRVYDTVPADNGIVLTPDEVFIDTHVSAVASPDGGLPGGSVYLFARATDVPGAPGADWYELTLFPDPDNSSRFRLILSKVVDLTYVHMSVTGTLYFPGPYLLELDAIDGDSPTGAKYTDVTARLTSNDSREQAVLSFRDSGTLGRMNRIESGLVGFGAGLNPDHRKAHWVLNTTLDDVSITATPAGEAPLEGDLNGDGSVNSTDLDLVRANWGQSVSPHVGGDADGDGLVGSADLDLVRANWGVSPAVAVPEPGVLAIMVFGVVFLAFRRRE